MLKKTKEKILKKIVDNLEYDVDKEIYTWPPICSFITHQPKRPKMTNQKENK